MSKPNINSITANDARTLDKLMRYYEKLMADPVLRDCKSNLKENYNRVMQRIYSVTQPALEHNVYSVPGIVKPLDNNNFL